MKKLTLAQKENYISNPNVCPYCSASESLDTHEPEFNGRSMSQDVWCSECGATWTDEYTLTDITELTEPEPKN